MSRVEPWERRTSATMLYEAREEAVDRMVRRMAYSSPYTREERLAMREATKRARKR